MTTTPIILVPGYWLGAWAWDEVADGLRSQGYDVTALTLPGLESVDAERSSITLSDHVDAIVDAIQAKDRPVVLAVHSGSGYAGYVVSDRIPEALAAMVYVDTGPGVPPADENFEGADLPMDWESLSAEENLDGISDAQLEVFRQRAVPQPGGTLREATPLTNDARLDVPTTVICTAFTSEQYKEAVKEGHSFLRGLQDLRNVTWVDLPTSHWPMWSKPEELTQILAEVAAGTSASAGA
jgi:pimeloyl-ACP methyl ester carboxylesterase